MKRRCIAAFSNKCKLLRSPLIRLAVRSTPSSVWEKAFIVVRFSRNLASLHNYCHPPRLFSAPNHRTRGSGQRSWTQGWRSQTEGESKKRTEESLLSSGRFRLSLATGHKTAVPPSRFIPAAFTATIQVLWYFLDSRKYRPPGKAAGIYRIFLFFCLFSSCCAVCVGAGRGCSG